MGWYFIKCRDSFTLLRLCIMLSVILVFQTLRRSACASNSVSNYAKLLWILHVKTCFWRGNIEQNSNIQMFSSVQKWNDFCLRALLFDINGIL
jgi:hypothetical protein